MSGSSPKAFRACGAWQGYQLRQGASTAPSPFVGIGSNCLVGRLAPGWDSDQRHQGPGWSETAASRSTFTDGSFGS